MYRFHSFIRQVFMQLLYARRCNGFWVYSGDENRNGSRIPDKETHNNGTDTKNGKCVTK